MFSFKRYMAQRALRKNVNSIKSSVKRGYRDISKELNRRISRVRLPLKVTISR